MRREEGRGLTSGDGETTALEATEDAIIKALLVIPCSSLHHYYYGGEDVVLINLDIIFNYSDQL